MAETPAGALATRRSAGAGRTALKPETREDSAVRGFGFSRTSWPAVIGCIDCVDDVRLKPDPQRWSLTLSAEAGPAELKPETP